MTQQVKILFIGDVVGKAGREVAALGVVAIRAERKIDFVIMNAENAAGGHGVTPGIAKELQKAGADVLTSGNHIFDKTEVYEILDEEPRLLRPANYPPRVPGMGWGVYVIKSNNGSSDAAKIAVINVQGRVFMPQTDCPFRTADDILEQLPDDITMIFVDVHCEATSEKQAMGRYLDGRVSVVVGTHTHVQTSDERILPGGTGYLTDAGMTGSTAGIIGVESEPVLERFLFSTPARFSPAHANPQVQGLIATLDSKTGSCIAIERILWSPDQVES